VDGRRDRLHGGRGGKIEDRETIQGFAERGEILIAVLATAEILVE
jgi:hypothetical protein